MRYQINHTTTYTYSLPVVLQPHLVQLRPRSDSHQSLQSFSMQVTPTPIQQSQVVDLEGNDVIKLWFAADTVTSLEVQVCSQVETHCTNPFVYMLEPWATQLPIAYPTAVLAQLHPYLSGQQFGYPAQIDPVILQLARELWQRVEGNTSFFLTELTNEIYKTCKQIVRETGDPLPAAVTWLEKVGSCRDLTVVFMEVCRAIGLAARFVSGYQEGDLDNPERHLHAWAEAYLPGAGWRGFDPSHGLVVADRHIALVANAFPRYAAPFAGEFLPVNGAVQSDLTYQLTIQRL